MREENCESEIISYEKIMNGTVEEKLNIAKSFSKKIDIIKLKIVHYLCIFFLLILFFLFLIKNTFM